MFVNDDIYYFLSDMTENEKRKEDDYLMTCLVINVSLLSYIFFRNSCFTKKLVVYHPLTNLSLASVGFLLIIETLIIILATKRSWVLQKRRYT